MYFTSLYYYLGPITLILFFNLASDTLASRLVGKKFRISLPCNVYIQPKWFLNLVVPCTSEFLRLKKTLQWIKHGCIKANGVSRCSRSPNILEIHPRWIELQHRASFEAGFPPYKTPEATYPICVQDLTWPLLWADVHFNLKTMCLSNDQANDNCMFCYSHP